MCSFRYALGFTTAILVAALAIALGSGRSSVQLLADIKIVMNFGFSLVVHGDDYTRKQPRFSPESIDRPVRVAIVGGGISGLTVAHALEESNKVRARGGTPAKVGWNLDHWGFGPEFNFTVFEASEHIGGHSWTVQFPTADGNTYPVDVGYAYNPTMESYWEVRRLERRYNIHMTGPLDQRVHVYKAGFQNLTNDQKAKLDGECDWFMKIVSFMQNFKTLSKVLYGLMPFRTFLRLHGFSDEFFLMRIYPVIRFVIVSGSKGKMLDATTVAGMMTFVSGWASCYNQELHGGFDWYTVRGGSESHLKVFKDQIGNRVLTRTPVQSVRHLGTGGVAVIYGAGTQQQQEIFDSVVMATAPDDAAKLQGPEAPAWLYDATTEEITCVLHSDDSVLPPNGQGGANMVYVAAGSDAEYANGILSVMWDSIHGDSVNPTPILTYNPEYLKANTTLKGEVFRRRFKHVHLPTGFGALHVSAGLAAAHNAPEARVFYVGSWVHGWSLSHPGAIASGWNVAMGLGARPDVEDFFMLGRKYDDWEGWEAELRDNKGKWPQRVCGPGRQQAL